MSYCTGSHTTFYHRFHVVWVTKYRFKVLRGEMRERLRDIIRQSCEEMGVSIVKGVLSTDHVHMFCRSRHICLCQMLCNGLRGALHAKSKWNTLNLENDIGDDGFGLGDTSQQQAAM